MSQIKGGIFISQRKYTCEILDGFKIAECKPIATPVEIGLKMCKNGNGKLVDPTFFKQLVGSLRYLTATRPDIIYGVRLTTRYKEKPTLIHLQREFYATSKEQSIMVFFMLQVMIQHLLGSLIAIGVMTLMKGKVHYEMYFSLVIMFFLGL